MFKGTIHFYKSIDGKEKEILKTFYEEKEFDEFVTKNIDIEALDEFEWEMSRRPSLSDLKIFYEEVMKVWDSHFIKELEKGFDTIGKNRKSLMDRSLRFLKK